MRSKQFYLIPAVFACFVFFGCDKKTEEFTSAPLSDYLPLQVGKYITYRLDSTVFTNFGTVVAVHSYQEKQIVDAKIPDALGRDSYRILRFFRDTSGNQPWAPAGTYSITPTDKTVEIIENNLRFVKLSLPIARDYTWKGNGYLVSWQTQSDSISLSDEPYSSMYNFANDDAMDDWNYTYSSIDDALTVRGKTYSNVVTVDGIDESFHADKQTFTVTDPSVVIAYVNYLQEKYAKGIGLISQQFIMWEYQGPNAANPTGVKVGFGVKRSIIDHN